MSNYSQFGIPSIDSSLKIIASEINEVCNNAKKYLDEENKSLLRMISVINMFITSSQFEGDAWNNVKNHYSDNITVIRGQLYANDLALKDYIKLQEIAGKEDLVASDIYNSIDFLIIRLNSYKSSVDSYNRNVINYINPYGNYYTTRYNMSAISNIESSIKALGKKLTHLQDIQDSTKNMFLEAKNIYDKVAQGLSAINTSWTGKSFTLLSNEQWAMDLNKIWNDEYKKELSKYYFKDFAGRKEYYWDNIEDLFEKDPSKVTVMEYQIICDLYSKMDDEYLEKFFACVYVPYKENESINKNFETRHTPANFYKLSPVYISAMKQFNSSINSLMNLIDYPFTKQNKAYAEHRIGKLAARSTLSINVIKYCPILARDQHAWFSFEQDEYKSRYEWITPIKNLTFFTDPIKAIYSYSGDFIDWALYGDGKWIYDHGRCHEINFKSSGISSGDRVQGVTNKLVCDYLHTLYDSNTDLAVGIGGGLLKEAAGSMFERLSSYLFLDTLMGMYIEVIDNTMIKQQVESINTSINVSEILEPMGIYPDVTIIITTSGKYEISLSNIRIDVKGFNNNTVYYLACLYTRDQVEAERLYDRYINDCESLTEVEKIALSDEKVEAMQKTLIYSFVNGKYSEKGTLYDFVETVNNRFPAR